LLTSTKEDFYPSLPASKNAVAAMQAITNSGEEVWIVISTTAGDRKVVSEQMKWVEMKFSPYWMERVIVARCVLIFGSESVGGMRRVKGFVFFPCAH
jgi:hypothetical protein